MDYDDFDFDSGVEWFKTDEHYRCDHCGHVGPAEAKAEQETQGDGLMTGTVTLATGELRCVECESSDLHGIPSSIVDAVKALAAEAIYEDGQMASGIAVRFLARMTLLRASVGLPVEAALLADAQAEINRPSSEDPAND